MEKSVQDIASILGLKLLSDRAFSFATCDSRQVKEKTLFLALSGERVEGTMFLKEVAERGGVAAVVPQSYQGESFGLDLLPVSDVKKALQEVAQTVFSKASPLVVGVTGTVGKTTTKEFLATLLAEKYATSKTLGSMNSQVGLPLTLLNDDQTAEILVLEMGMSQKGELANLARIAQPHLGVLTKVTLAHAEFFNDLEGIAEAKCELFTSKRMERGFFHVSTKDFHAVQEVSCPKTWFDGGGPYCPFEETHLMENFAAAVSVARYLGLSDAEIKRGAEKLKPFDHRFQKVEKKGVLFIDDTYNASPEAAKMAFSNLPEGKKRIAVFGAMKELGQFEASSHRDVAFHALPLIDHLICIGDECLPMVEVFQKGGKKVDHTKTKQEALKHLLKVVEKGDVVLIKGSNSYRLWTLLEEI